MWDIIKTCTLLLLILLPFFTLLWFTLVVGGGRGQDGRDGTDGKDGKDGRTVFRGNAISSFMLPPQTISRADFINDC
jgi:hypothetical protein